MTEFITGPDEQPDMLAHRVTFLLFGHVPTPETRRYYWSLICRRCRKQFFAERNGRWEARPPEGMGVCDGAD